MRIISPKELKPYAPVGMECVICDIAKPILKKHGVTWCELLALTINPVTWRVPSRIVDVILELIPVSHFTKVPMLEYHLGMDGRMLNYIFHKYKYPRKVHHEDIT